MYYLFGAEENCARKDIAKVRSGQVLITRHMIDTIIDSYVFMFLSTSSELDQVSIVTGSIGWIVGLQSCKANHERIESMYAVCDNSIPFGPSLI
jgi:hypothetical protein